MPMLLAKRRFAALFFFGFFLVACGCAPAYAQNAPEAAPPAEFTQLADQLAAGRATDAQESEAPEERALEMLDRVALAALNAAPDPAIVNQRLAKFVTREPPLGEGFRVFALGGSPSSFALLADFGEAGPSAVRIYSGVPGKLSLAARVDRYAQKDFLDDYIELVPVPGPAAIFVTVAGRTDDFKTGVFTAWHFDGQRAEPVWTSDIVAESNYEVSAGGFQLDYCADDTPDDPRSCKQMRRERYVWQDSSWKQAELPPPVPAGGPR